MNKKPSFSEKSKLYEMIATAPKLLQLLPRFGIQLGFGDHNIAEVCQANGVNTKLFLLICNIYADPAATLHPKDLEHELAAHPVARVVLV